jgi:hypothetical protein
MADEEEVLMLKREKAAIKKFSKMQKAQESVVDLSASDDSEDGESEGEGEGEGENKPFSDHALIDAQKLQKKFYGHIIRRTHNSAGKGGTISENIIGLVKPIFRTILFPLTQDEQDTMRKIAAADGTTPKKLKKNSTFLDFSLQATVEHYGTVSCYLRVSMFADLML